MSCHGSVRIELPGRGDNEKTGPKVRKVKKEIQEKLYVLKLNVRTPISQNVPLQVAAKGRNYIFPLILKIAH
jgi:hypothetical protein